MEKIFIHSEADIPDDFFKIITISSIIGGCKYHPNIPITFEYNNNDHSVVIIQKKYYGFGKNESLLSFYNHYNYTKGYKHLLLDTDKYINNLKIFNKGENISMGWKLYSNIYISKSYLENIYNIEYLPELLYLILSHNFKKIIFNMNEIKSYINPPLNLNTLNLKKYKINFFKHQINNIRWMINLENKIKNNYCINTYKLPNNLVNTILYYLKIINKYIIVNSSGKIINLETQEKNIKIYPRGGVLSDDVGLGKTFCMLSLINETKNNKCSLIICPKRLIKIWENEISNTTTDLKYIAVYTIIQWRKLNIHNIKDYDLIIVPYNFLINKNYEEHCEKQKFNLLSYSWNRIILDEGHEFISTNKSNYMKNITKKNYMSVKDYIKKIKAEYFWICSATPFSNYYDFWEVIDFIFGYKLNLEYSYILNFDKNAYRKTKINSIHHTIYDLCQNLFIRSSKKDTNIDIPKPIIENKLLKQTPLEKIIYDGENHRFKKIQLCSHILVSEDNINILGKNPISFEEIYNKMNDHYIKKITKIKKSLLKRVKIFKKKDENELFNNIENNLKNDNIADIKFPINNEDGEEYSEFNKDFAKLKLMKYKHNIYNKLKTEIDNNNECSICYESFSNLQKGILHCGHYFCINCIQQIYKKSQSKIIICPMCRFKSNSGNINIIKCGFTESKWGTKILNIIDYINNIQSEYNSAKFIIFSQWDNMLKLISKILEEYKMKYIFIKGTAYSINKKILTFKLSNDIKIILLSSDKNVSGLNLTEVNYIILLDTFNTDKEECKIIEEQAIGRAYRIGQTKQIYVTRFIMEDTVEEEYFKINC